MRTIPGQYHYDHQSPPESPDADRYTNAVAEVERCLAFGLDRDCKLAFDEGPRERTIRVDLRLTIEADGLERDQLIAQLAWLFNAVKKSKP